MDVSLTLTRASQWRRTDGGGGVLMITPSHFRAKFKKNSFRALGEAGGKGGKEVPDGVNVLN